MHDTFFKVLQCATLCLVLGTLIATAHAQSQGSWTIKAPIPLARNEVALAAVAGKVHVIGGGVKGIAGTYHDEYDPATDRWRSRAPLPQGLDHIGTAVLNGKIYTVGGFVASVHKDGQPHVFEYDPAIDTWRSLSPLKSGLGSVAVTVTVAAGSATGTLCTAEPRPTMDPGTAAHHRSRAKRDPERAAQHPGNAVIYIHKSIRCGISGMSAGGIG